MDPVNGINQLLQLARARLEKKGAPLKGSPKGSGSTAEKPHSSTENLTDQLKRRLQERVPGLSSSDYDEKAAAEIFVETVLLREFGEHLMNDPEFSNLCKEVSNQIQGHTEARAKLKAFLQHI